MRSIAWLLIIIEHHQPELLLILSQAPSQQARNGVVPKEQQAQSIGMRVGLCQGWNWVHGLGNMRQTMT